MLYLMDYEGGPFSAFGNFCFVPILGPIVGAILGIYFYQGTIGAHLIEMQN